MLSHHSHRAVIIVLFIEVYDMATGNSNVSNEVFPDWPTANVVIGKLMAAVLGPYLE